MKILANDGIHPAGKQLLEDSGHTVITDKVGQEDLAAYLKDEQVSALLVRSATKVNKAELDSWGGLKVIGRAGVGIDNIDSAYAKEVGIAVVNTPAASSQSVAELALAKMLTISRFLQDSNRKMPVTGVTEFGALKKSYAKGVELQGATLGVVGFGRIGQCLAKMALGMGMIVVAHDPFLASVNLHVDIAGTKGVDVNIKTSTFEEVLVQSDFLSLHVPKPKEGSLIGEAEFAKMKDGSIIVNCARGGVINENDLIAALDSGKLMGAGLDVFENEPTPEPKLLSHSKISLTPHIGSSTNAAQNRIGIELAEKVMDNLG
jgi:D-3-phosphoglycerate dehydrogenase